MSENVFSDLSGIYDVLRQAYVRTPARGLSVTLFIQDGYRFALSR